MKKTLVGAVVVAILTCAVPVAAQERPLRGSAMVAPTLGQSALGGTGFRTKAFRYELGAHARLGLFRADLSVGLSHFLAGKPKLDGTAFTDPNCVDPVVQGCVGVAKRDARLEVADTLVRLGLEAVSMPVFALVPRLELVAPTSAYSRERAMWFGSHIGADAEFDIGDRLRVVASGRFRKDFHAKKSLTPYVAPADDLPVELAGEVAPEAVVYAPRSTSPDRVGSGSYGYRTAGSHLPGREEDRVYGLSWSHGVHLGVDAELHILAGFFADLGFRWTAVWTYALPEGIPEPERRGRLKMTTGTVGVGWRTPAGPLDLSVRLGSATTSPTARRSFPWWNTQDAAFDDSTVDLQLTAIY